MVSLSCSLLFELPYSRIPYCVFIWNLARNFHVGDLEYEDTHLGGKREQESLSCSFVAVIISESEVYSDFSFDNICNFSERR